MTTPDLSFVIPVFNRRDLTERFVANLAETVAGNSWEAVIVDDGSTDNTPAFLDSLAHPFRSLRLERNSGYAHAVNRGVAITSGEVIGLLNNDLILSPGWLEPMENLLKSTPGAGAVGNVQINPKTGLVDHAGVFFDPEGMPAQAHKNRKKPPRGRWKERNAITAACMLVRRYVFDTLGGFDETFRNGMEDIDFCVRMRMAGHRVLVSHESIVGHLVSSSPGRHSSNAANRERFRKIRAPDAVRFGAVEWPGEYLRRYARHWWRMNPVKGWMALRMLLVRSIYRTAKKPID